MQTNFNLHKTGVSLLTTTLTTLSLLWIVGALCSPVAHAQDAQQRQAAGQAYDRGSSAFLAEDYSAAARWFETAHRLAPAAPALLQAIRAHKLSGNDLRAASLALRLVDEYEGALVEEGQALVDEFSPRFYRVQVNCDECAVQVDGTLSYPLFFVSPSENHHVVIGFSTGDVEQDVAGAAGQSEVINPVAPDPPPDLPPSGPDGEPVVEDGGGLPPALFITSLILTAGVGITTIWSGVDTTSGVDEYEQTAMQGNRARAVELLTAGQKKEARTNTLIGITAGLAAVTVVLAIVTDWDGSPDDEDEDEDAISFQPDIQVGPGQGSVGVRGTF